MMPRRDGATMVHLAIDPELQRQIADFRYDNHIPTKRAAWEWLARWALKSGARPTPEELAEMERG